MRRSQLVTILVVTTIIVGILSVYSLDTTVSAAVTIPTVDSTTNSHQTKTMQNTASTSVTITTSAMQEIIYASIYSETANLGLTISSTPTLTWHYRGGENITNGNNKGDMAVWWAVSTIAQPVTITFTSSSSTNMVVSAFGVINADTTSPFDSNLGSAIYISGNSKTSTASITTANANDLIVGVVAYAGTNTITIGNGYTQITNTGCSSPAGATEYLAVSKFRNVFSNIYFKQHIEMD